MVETPDGLRIHARQIPIGGPRAVALIAHGHGEHSSRHEYTAEKFAREGIRPVLFDFRGHGRSSGRRGDAIVSDYLTDLKAVRESVAGDLPMLVFGHSMGGLLAILDTLSDPGAYRAMILTSPWLELGFSPPAWKTAIAKTLLGTFPSFRLHTGLHAGQMSADPQIQLDDEDRKLIHRLMSVRLYFSLLRAAEDVRSRAADILIPMYVIHGGDDPVMSPDSTSAFVEAAVNSPGRILDVPDAVRHEPHNDATREDLFRKVIDWVRMVLG